LLRLNFDELQCRQCGQAFLAVPAQPWEPSQNLKSKPDLILLPGLNLDVRPSG
jgi:hypothetical protein